MSCSNISGSPDPQQSIAEPEIAQALLEKWTAAAIVLDAHLRMCWASRRAQEWLQIGSAPGAPPPPWHTLPLPWKIERGVLQTVLSGTEATLPPADLIDAEGVVRRCEARLTPLRGASEIIGVLVLISPARSEQVGQWEWDLRRGEFTIDAQWCRALDVDPCLGAGQCTAWIRNIHPDDQPEFRRRMQTLDDHEVARFEVEYRMLTRDFRWVWIMQRGRVIERGPDGAPRRLSGICIDVDEGKRSEMALHESESRLANALWSARASLWCWHIQPDVITESPMWFALTGYTQEEWNSIPDPWSSRVHPEDRERVAIAVRRHLEGESQALEYEYRFRTAAGDWRWMLDRGRVVEWDSSGAPTVAIGVSLDIHSQKDAELRLRSSEARLETAVWGAGMGLFELDLGARRLKWFNDWCVQAGFDPCEEDSARWPQNIHPQDRAEAMRLFDAHLAGTTDSYAAEYRLRTRSGGWKWVLDRIRIIEREPGGAPLRMVGVILDIDARKSAELAAYEAQRRLQFAVKSLSAGVWEWEAASGMSATTLETFSKILGRDVTPQSEEEIWLPNVHPDDLERLRKVVADSRHRSNGDTFEIEYRIRHADGSWRWVLDRAYAIDHDEAGRATRIIGFIADITSSKRAEEALLESEQRFRLAAEAVQGMIFESDPLRGSVVHYGTERVLGYQPADLASELERHFGLVHPDDQDRLHALCRTAAPVSVPVEAQFRVRHRDGHYLHVLSRMVPYRDASGRIVKTIGFTMDVSELVKAQEALRRSDLFYRAILALSPGFGFEFLLTDDGRIVLQSATEGFDRVFGCTIEEFEGRGGWDVFLDHQSLVASGVRRERLRSGETVMGDVRFRTMRGEVRWVSVIVNPKRDAATGKVVGGIGSMLDITQRKLAEETLRHSQSLMRTIADGSTSWLMLLDREQRCQFVNRSINGITVEEAVGRTLEEIDPHPSRLQVRALLQRVLDTGEPATYQCSVEESAAGRRHFDCRATAVRSDGRIHGLVLTMTEITSWRRAEDTLRTQGHILETMEEGVVLVDEDDLIRLTNPAFEAMFGYEAGELAGQPIGSLFQLTETRRAFIEKRRTLISRRRREPNEEGNTPVEFECVRRDGTHFVAACVITAIELDGDLHWLAVVTDVTERKRMEREIVEIANREQRRIGSDLHDGLGQDLTGIALMLRSIESRLRADRPDLCREVQHVVGLIGTAIESTRAMAYGLSPVSAVRGGLLVALQSLAERSSDRFGAQVHFSNRLRDPLKVDEDAATQLYRIAQEAVTNAVRHGHARSIGIEIEVDDGWIHLCIKDDGRGFDPLTTSSSGMGLKIMEYRSQLLRGDLTIRAREDRGMEVCCICPNGSAAEGFPHERWLRVH